MNHKMLLRLYSGKNLWVRRRRGRNRAMGTRALMTLPQGPNQRWSLDFVSDTLVCSRRFRILAVVDDFTRECPALVVDTWLSGARIARELDAIIAERGPPLMIVSDNGIQFTFPPCYADGPTAQYITHMFDMRCRENGIEHRLTKVRHPWTNGQVEPMNRTIKEATVKRYHYDSHAQLTAHLNDFINAYNYGRRLKTLRGLTPYEYICKCWTTEPQRFTSNPHHQMPGPNN